MSASLHRNSLKIGALFFFLLTFVFPWQLSLAGVLKPVRVEVPFVRQHTGMWCWLAVAEMALRYKKGASPPQCRLADLAFALPPGSCCKPGRCQKGASLNVIKELLAKRGVKSRLQGPEISFEEVYNLLEKRNIFIVRLVRRSRSMIRVGPKSLGHVVVLRGVRFVPPPPRSPLAIQNRPMPLVLINDPRFFRPIEVPFVDVASNWEGMLVVR